MGPNSVRGHAPVFKKVSYSATLITKKRYRVNERENVVREGSLLDRFGECSDRWCCR